MRVTWGLILASTIAFAGCKGDRGTRKKGGKSGQGAGAQAGETGAAGGGASAMPSRVRPRVPPITLEVGSTITGKKLRPWARGRSAGGKRVAGEEIPELVRAELVALLEPVSKARPRVRWVRVMKAEGGRGAATIALSYGYKVKDKYGTGHTVGFTAARDRGGKFHVHQAVEVSKRDGGDWQFGKDRDVDGDGVADTCVLYNQPLDPADPTGAAEGGIVLLGSKAASAHQVQLFERSRADGQTEITRSWTNCWATLDGRKVLLVISQHETLVEVGGEQKPMRTKYTADVIAADKAGNLKPTTLYGGILGGATVVEPLIEEWTEWTDSKSEPGIELKPRAEALDPVDCPTGKKAAFIVPKRVTKPKGNLGHYLLAWPSLDKAVTGKGADSAHLPSTAVVEIGGE